MAELVSIKYERKTKLWEGPCWKVCIRGHVVAVADSEERANFLAAFLNTMLSNSNVRLPELPPQTFGRFTRLEDI